MSSVLISPTVLEKHSAVAGPKISYEPTTDIFFEHLSARFAHLAQICITGKNDSLVFREWFLPGKVARNGTNAGRKLVLIQRRAGRIEAREFTELHHGACHDKAAASIFVSKLVARRSCSLRTSRAGEISGNAPLTIRRLEFQRCAASCGAARHRVLPPPNRSPGALRLLVRG